MWWEKGFDPDEDAAVREIVAAFEQASGKRIELDQPLQNIEAKVLAALSAGRPPDFAFGTNTDYWYGQWAYEDRLIDLSDVIGPFAKPVRLDAIGTSKLPAVTRVGPRHARLCLRVAPVPGFAGRLPPLRSTGLMAHRLRGNIGPAD